MLRKSSNLKLVEKKMLKKVLNLLIWKLYFAFSLLLILNTKVFWASITDFRKNSKIQFFSHFFPIFKCSCIGALWSDLYSRYSRRYAWLIFSTIQLWVIVMHHGSTQALKCLNWNNSHFKLHIHWVRWDVSS